MIGDVVMARYPYTDLRAAKPRPAVVLADVGMSDWIVCEVTSSGQLRGREVRISNNDLARGRLRRRSYARTDRLFTLNESVLNRTVGRLTNAKLSEILAATRALFQPPSRT